MKWPDTRSIVAVLVVSGCLLIFGALFFVKIPTENAAQINLVLGSMLGSFTTAVAFYLGSSKSSTEKDDTIAGQLKGAS